VVTVVVAATNLEVSVVDDGTGDPSRFNPGRGITGMRERAALHEGTVTIQGTENGGVEVRATLSWEGPGE
jgi:signal transduction histidine kinase